MKLIARILIVALASMTTSSQAASLNSTLNTMFVGNVTQPGAYSSATRGGFVGGDVYLRAPVKPITLTTFDAPRLNAGCGGIDIYGGSFSFINLSQFAALIRMIIANAAGLLFQTALCAINPSLCSISQQFQKLMQDLNSTMSNTCAIANQAVKALHDPAAAKTALDEAGSNLSSYMGNLMDPAAWKASSPQAKQAAGQQAEPFDPTSGNLTWKALARSQSQDMIGQVGAIADPADPNGVLTKLFLISLIGTEVKTSFTMDANGNSTTASACTPTTGTPGTCGSSETSQVMPYTKLFSVGDLIYENTLQIYTCGGPVASGDATPQDKNSCLFMGTKTTLDFPGTLNYVKNMLYGNSAATTSAAIVAGAAGTASNPDPSSIYGKITKCTTTGCNLTPAQQSFLMSSGPLYKLVKETQFDPASLPVVSAQIEQYMAYAIARSMGSAALRAINQAWSGVRDVAMPQSIANNIQAVGNDLNALAAAQMQLSDDLLKAQLFADNVRKAVPVVMPHN